MEEQKEFSLDAETLREKLEEMFSPVAETPAVKKEEVPQVVVEDKPVSPAAPLRKTKLFSDEEEEEEEERIEFDIKHAIISSEILKRPEF